MCLLPEFPTSQIYLYHTVVIDRDSLFGTEVALGQATNEKSQKLQNVAIVTRKNGFADFGVLFDPEELAISYYNLSSVMDSVCALLGR